MTPLEKACEAIKCWFPNVVSVRDGKPTIDRKLAVLIRAAKDEEREEIVGLLEKLSNRDDLSPGTLFVVVQRITARAKEGK
mgnify:CR=1 FL=1